MKSVVIQMLLFSGYISREQTRGVKLSYPGVVMLPRNYVQFAQMKNRVKKWDESFANVVNDKEYMSEEADVLSEHKIENPSQYESTIDQFNQKLAQEEQEELKLQQQEQQEKLKKEQQEKADDERRDKIINDFYAQKEAKKEVEKLQQQLQNINIAEKKEQSLASFPSEQSKKVEESIKKVEKSSERKTETKVEEVQKKNEIPVIDRELVEDYTSNAQTKNEETHDLTNKIVEQALDRTISVAQGMISVSSNSQYMLRKLDDQFKTFCQTLKIEDYENAIKTFQEVKKRSDLKPQDIQIQMNLTQKVRSGFKYFPQIAENDFVQDQLDQLQAAEDNLMLNPDNYLIMQTMLNVNNQVIKNIKEKFPNDWINPFSKK